MSSPPKVSTAVPTKRSAKPSSLTLPTHETASPPEPVIAASVSSAGSASRSLTTMRAPSEASFRAISRPIPRPEPETSATFPSSVLMPAPLLRALREGDDGVALHGDRAVRERDCELDGRATLAVDLLDRDDLPGAGRLGADRGDRAEADPERTELLLRHPGDQEPSEVRHREHSVREDIGEPDRSRVVEVDVDRVVVARCARKERQGRTVDGIYRQRWEFRAYVD